MARTELSVSPPDRPPSLSAAANSAHVLPPGFPADFLVNLGLELPASWCVYLASFPKPR